MSDGVSFSGIVSHIGGETVLVWEVNGMLSSCARISKPILAVFPEVNCDE